jgi:hypothetical protein
MLTLVPAAVWVGVGLAAGIFLTSLAVMGIAMAHAEHGVDPFANLPAFDDDEAAALLERGA